MEDSKPQLVDMTESHNGTGGGTESKPQLAIAGMQDSALGIGGESLYSQNTY